MYQVCITHMMDNRPWNAKNEPACTQFIVLLVSQSILDHVGCSRARFEGNYIYYQMTSPVTISGSFDQSWLVAVAVMAFWSQQSFDQLQSWLIWANDPTWPVNTRCTQTNDMSPPLAARGTSSCACMLLPPSNQHIQQYLTTLIIQGMSLWIADAVFVNRVTKATVQFCL